MDRVTCRLIRSLRWDLICGSTLTLIRWRTLTFTEGFTLTRAAMRAARLISRFTRGSGSMEMVWLNAREAGRSRQTVKRPTVIEGRMGLPLDRVGLRQGKAAQVFDPGKLRNVAKVVTSDE
jgi:hypothetical protein